jgi:hypothetical protein
MSCVYRFGVGHGPPLELPLLSRGGATDHSVAPEGLEKCPPASVPGGDCGNGVPATWVFLTSLIANC